MGDSDGMNATRELFTMVRRVLTLLTGAMTPEPGARPQKPAHELPVTRSHADRGNGVRWSDVVAAMESERA